MTAPAVARPILPEHADSWALVHRAQAGDADAFGQLYRRHADTIFRFVYYRTRNRQLAEDLCGEAWLRAFRRIGSISYQGLDFISWVTTIARNLVADYFKSGRYRLEITIGDALDAADREDREPGPEALTLGYLSNLDLLGAVQKLNDEQRQCIVLRFLNGCTLAETAAAMGKNESAIKALQYRAVGSLRRLYPLTAEEA